MNIRWTEGGVSNGPFELEHGYSGETIESPGGIKVSKYEFSLCRKQEEDDPHAVRLFVYRSTWIGGGYQHIGGFRSAEEAKEKAGWWKDDQAI